MATLSIPRAFNPVAQDDEIAALVAQIEELDLLAQKGKGKYPVGHPPDFELACQSFQAELETHRGYLSDWKLAQSIACAVHEDSALIAQWASEDIQAHEDRRMALQLGHERPGGETVSLSPSSKRRPSIDDWVSTLSETVAAISLRDYCDDDDGDDEKAGPSMTFAERQADILRKMSAEFKCCVCHENHPATMLVKPACQHRYCVDCAKGLFMRATKDETLFPPRCCKNPISPTLVTRHMSAEQVVAFEAARVEFTTVDRVYCSNLQCGRFVPPALIDARTRVAACGSCGTHTCSLCKGNYHPQGDCPKDPSLVETRRLAREMGWQTCPSCNFIVQLRSGCNHMICRCKTEFCYVCGVLWKNCGCNAADEHRLIERAEEVVDRDAEPDLPHAERDRRVRRIHAELRVNHECAHPGRFQRIFPGKGVRGFQCEICDGRHRKYILQCRHCYVNVCEDCRRNRI